MMFENRLDAARRLAEALSAHAGSRPLVLAIPRGAVPMGAALAEALDGELDVVLVHKLGSRWNAEYAVGAIDESGWSFVSDPGEAEEAWLEEERARRLAGLRERRQLYSPGRPPVDAHGRTVIIVDDGLATGATMRAAIRAARARQAAEVVVAVPIAAAETVEEMRSEADSVVCLETPSPFWAVGQGYKDFNQVSDEEVIAALGPRRDAAPPPARV